MKYHASFDPRPFHRDMVQPLDNLPSQCEYGRTKIEKH